MAKPTEIPAEAQRRIIETAAAVVNRPVEEISLADALEILQVEAREPHVIDVMGLLSRDTAAEFFENLTDEQAGKLTEAAKNGKLQEGLKSFAAIMGRDLDKETAAAGNSGADPAGPEDSITIDAPEIAPEVDPDSPNFNANEWKKQTAGAAASLKRTIEAISIDPAAMETINALVKISSESLNEASGIIHDLRETVFKGLTGAQLFFNSNAWQNLRESLTRIAEGAPQLLFAAQKMQELFPYLEAELKKPEYEGKTIDDLYDEAELDENGEPAAGSLFDQLVSAAMDALEADQKKKQLPAIDYKGTPDINLTVGKASYILFNPETEDKVRRGELPLYIDDEITGQLKSKKGDIPGQLSFFPIKYESEGKEEITLYCGIDRDEGFIEKLGLQGALDDTDYFYLSFLADAFIEGNSLMSVRKLYKDYIGGDPNPDQLTRFINRLDKLAATRVHINDKDLRKAWGADEQNATYKFISQQAAPITIGGEKFVTGGQVAEATIKIHEFPAILAIDYDIGQYTTVTKSLLQVKKKNGRSPRKNERYYRVLHYLVRKIARIKRGKLRNKILYDTFYKDTNETTERDKQLAREMLFTILDHFVREQWITGYKEEVTKSTGKAGLKFTWKDTGEKKKKAVKKK